jgi:hypothetical protein
MVYDFIQNGFTRTEDKAIINVDNDDAIVSDEQTFVDTALMESNGE